MEMGLIGVVITILMWSTLAASVELLHGVPTLFVNGVALTVGGLLGLPWARHWKMPAGLLVLGTLSMFAYHVIYFYALQFGEPVGVSLIHYLWPLLIVLLAPRSRLHDTRSVRQWFGILTGLGGAALACMSTSGLSSGSSLVVTLGAHFGSYALALLSAFVWAGYSLLGPRYESVSSHAVGAFCLGAGLACLALYSMGGTWPLLTVKDTIALLYLGLGPMGAAFYLWDFGMKRCDPRKVAALSYATPVLSTIFLCVYLDRPMSVTLWLGALMVTVSIATTGRSRSPTGSTVRGRAATTRTAYSKN
jgi:drug/metabolite transporter (DMT)-like permease